MFSVFKHGSAESVTDASASSELPLHTMVTLLCIVSGSLDAISFLALGEAFASVMTGNIVFLGVAAGTRDPHLALFCGIAIAGYVLGTVAGSWLVEHWKTTAETRIWPARVTKTLGVQFGVLLAASIAWICLGGEPADDFKIVFLLVAAGMMGIQGAAVRQVGVPVSTTYMTGALTTLLEAIVTRRPFSSTESSAVGGLLSLALGALLGSLALAFLRAFALLVPMFALGAVLAIRLTNHKLRS